MASLVGHVVPGFGFFVIGLWHLLNHIKLHALHPNSYFSLPWFPAPKIRYLELFLIMGGSAASIFMELFIGPGRHELFDLDGTIPSNHLHYFEHSIISLTLLVYATFAIILDCIGSKAQFDLAQLIGAAAFGLEFLLFHFHSSDHMGVEGQYHWLLQLVILVSLLTTLMGIRYPKSFLMSFVRSFSILFQGVWLMVMGLMLEIPEFIPKGCFLNLENGYKMVRCHTLEALDRAKSMVNIEFGWYLVLFIILSMCLFVFMIKIYPEKVEYEALRKYEDQEEEVGDIEAQKRRSKFGQSKSIFQMGNGLAAKNDENHETEKGSN